MSYEDEAPALTEREELENLRAELSRVQVRHRGPKPDRGPGMPERLDRLTKELHVIGEGVERLTAVLEPVLGPEPPVDALGMVAAEPTSQLADRLQNLTEHAERLGRDLRVLAQRVDL